MPAKSIDLVCPCGSNNVHMRPEVTLDFVAEDNAVRVKGWCEGSTGEHEVLVVLRFHEGITSVHVAPY